MSKLLSAVVLHEGWETDNEAWIEKSEDGSLVLKTTNHGAVCDMSVDDLKLKIEETKESLKQLNALLERFL